MMWGDNWNMGWTWLFGLLLIIGIVLLVVLAVRLLGGGRTQGGRPGEAGRSHARRILDERYAKGDLTAEQYREQVQVLGENP